MLFVDPPDTADPRRFGQYRDYAASAEQRAKTADGYFLAGL